MPLDVPCPYAAFCVAFCAAFWVAFWFAFYLRDLSRCDEFVTGANFCSWCGTASDVPAPSHPYYTHSRLGWGPLMNRLLITIAAVSTLALTQIANAADMPVKAPVAPAPALYSWTGF